MNQWLAVDGGQTGLRLKALPDGRTGHGPGFRYRGDDVVSAVVPAIEQAASQAGVSGPVTVLCAGLSGLPVEPGLLRALAYALCERLDVGEVRLTTDVVTAHAGALPDRAGVVLAAGTGVVCLGVDAAGESRRTDGWGHLFGDAGSAFDIGRQALVAVQRSHDRRGEPTELVQAAMRWFGTDPDRLPQRLYQSDAVVAKVAGFAPAVVACAEAGDQAAAAIVRQAGEQLARTAVGALTGLSFGDSTVALARVGQLWDAGPMLTEPFESELARLAPQSRVVEPVGDALAGAERMAVSDPGRYRTLLSCFTAAELGLADRGAVARRGRPSQVAGESDPEHARMPFPSGTLLVSCQAQPDSPLHGSEQMAAMARAAVTGGAAAVRVNGEADIAAARSVVDHPVIGLLKRGSRSGVYITPTIAAAEAVVRAGADVVALDGTQRVRLDGAALADQIAAVHRTGAIVMADVDSLSAGVAAREAGADVVATSLAGYTADEPPPDEPDLELLANLAAALDCPVIAEGRYRTAQDMRAALDRGAYAVVIGTAITNPTAITRRILGR